jgi:hypothetical protein
MTERCTIIRLRLDDLERSAEDPRLAALLHDGWRIEESLALSEEDGPPSWVLLLSPPSEESEERLADAVERRTRSALGLSLLLAFLAGLLGTGIGYLLA